MFKYVLNGQQWRAAYFILQWPLKSAWHTNFDVPLIPMWVQAL